MGGYLAPWTAAFVEHLYEHGEMDFDDALMFGMNHVPPGVAIRKYRQYYDWSSKKNTKKPLGPLISHDDQIRAGARRMLVQAIWTLRSRGGLDITTSNGKTTVRLTDIGRERYEKRHA